MTRDRKPPRQPLFWAAVAFSLGLWAGVRAWRPPSWWVIAVVAFIFAASWFLQKRSWFAKALAVGAWFLLGALLIQVRALPAVDPRIFALSDGRPVLLTGHIIKEGYAQSAYPGSIRESIDLETETVASQGESWPIRAGVRLTIHETTEVPNRAAGPSNRLISDGPMRSPDGPILGYGTRIQVSAKLHPPRNYRNPGAFDYEGYLLDNGISVLGSADA